MEPFLSAILAALGAGALAKAGDIGGKAVSDSYEALKALLIGKLGKSGAVLSVEDDPKSDPAKVALADAIAKADLIDDAELAERADKVRSAIAEANNAGLSDIKLDDIVGYANVIVADLVASGSIHVRGIRAETGDVKITGLSAGTEESKKD